MNLNKVVLIGRLTHDPEMRSTSSGQNVTSLKMATNRVWNDKSGQRQESTEYHSIVAWARLGEIANQYLKRGALVMIEGRLQTRSWTDQNNNKRYRTEIIAENLQMGPRSASSGQASSSADGYSRQASYSAPRENTGQASSQQAGSSQPSSGQAHSTSSGQAVQDKDIPIIDENEPTTQGVDEEEVSIKEKDLPF